MDFPNYSKQQGSSYHYQHSSRGLGGGGYHYQPSPSAYHGSSPYAEAPPPGGFHDPYRYGGGDDVAPYRYQHRSDRAAAATATSSSRRAMTSERIPSDRYDNLKPSSMERAGFDGGGDAWYGRKATTKRHDEDASNLYPSVAPDRFHGKSIYDSAKHHDEDAYNYYPSVAQDHFRGKSMYDPEVPSLVGSEHSSFEIPSDDDDDNMWDRKIRPGEKVGLSNGYFSEEEMEPYTTRPMKPRAIAEVPAAAPKQQIQVAPGEWLPLRGASETWAAVQNDFYMPTGCLCCQQTIFCIQDAAFVLCPKCKVVSPGFGEDPVEGGVGLGFTMEELAKWQMDIERSQKEAAKRM